MNATDLLEQGVDPFEDWREAPIDKCLTCDTVDQKFISGQQTVTDSKLKDEKITISYILEKKDLMCVICYDDLTRRIFRCSNGNHYVCGTCVLKIKRCPVCNCDVLVRDLLLEQQLKNNIKQCSNYKNGCTALIFKWNKEHEEKCFYKPIPCPLCGMILKYDNDVLFTHLKKKCPKNNFYFDVYVEDVDGTKLISLYVTPDSSDKNKLNSLCHTSNSTNKNKRKQFFNPGDKNDHFRLFSFNSVWHTSNSTNKNKRKQFFNPRDKNDHWINKRDYKTLFISCSDKLEGKFVNLTCGDGIKNIKITYHIPIITNLSSDISNHVLCTVNSLPMIVGGYTITKLYNPQLPMVVGGYTIW